MQQQLIASHITLCREDELELLEMIIAHLQQLRLAPITVQFGAVTPFDNGKGIMLPALGENTAFHELRKAVLQPIIATPRLHEPHLTLMHPRNATCTDEIFEVIQSTNLPRQLTFTVISLIQQCNGGKWQALK